MSEWVGGLDARDRAFVHALSFGTTRLRGRLDHLIAPHVHRGLDSVERPLLESLRLGAYQALYMDSVPPYAAVSETVAQVRRRHGGGPAGFANAVLRKVVAAGDGAERFPAETDPLAHLTAWGSHPAWLVRRWLARWDAASVRRLVEANNSQPHVSIVPLEGSPEDAAARLRDHGIEAEPFGMGTRCLRLESAADVRRALDVAGPAVVQDPGANLVVAYADVPSGTVVADLCAAPGGKILALPGRPAQVLALDRSESRIHILNENARRTGRRIGLVVADGRRPPLVDADVVLLDVPCTGTGTLGRHPDGRWRLAPDAIDAMVALQAELLDAAADVVRPGGLLVYSTCSLEREENEDAVTGFLTRRPGFRLEPSDTVDARLLDDEGHLVVTPQEHGVDGAFAARLRRAA